MSRQAAAVIIIVLSLMTVAVGWIISAFGDIWGAVAIVVIFVPACIALGWLMTLSTQRATLNAIVDFQAADDQGETERARTMTALVKGHTAVEEIAARFAAQQQRSLPAPTQAQLPMWEPSDATKGNIIYIED